MTPLEKNLALAVGLLVPVILVFFAFFWFMDRFDANESRIDELTAQVEEQEDKLQRGKNASSRSSYYRFISLPSKKSRAVNAYTLWLYDVVEKECKMSFSGARNKEAGALTYQRDSIASRNAFTISPKGTLEQLIQFLHIFYSADHLHRINKLSVRPIGKKMPGNKPAVLTGELKLEIEIETLSLRDGPADIESFPAWQKKLPEMDQYTSSILTRNIFGPANNVPTFEKPGKTEFTHVKSEEDTLGKYETITLTATDADKDNVLSFELIEQSGNENYGIQLGEQPLTSATRRIQLRVPKQARPVRIPVSVRVSDDGLPAKSDQIDFTIVFKKPTEIKVEKKPAPKMAKAASLTSVVGLMRGNDGRWVVRIHYAPNLRSEQYGEGDTLSIDDVDWKVVEVTDKTVSFEVDGERQTFAIESNLDQPIPALP